MYPSYQRSIKYAPDSDKYFGAGLFCMVDLFQTDLLSNKTFDSFDVVYNYIIILSHKKRWWLKKQSALI